jgi:hypothetical protein
MKRDRTSSLLLLLLPLLLPNLALGDFSYMECLKSNFSTSTSHEVAPFGVTKNILKVDKNGCTIIIHHERYKYLKTKWEVDVCRTPVHIKEGVGAVAVIKRAVSCQNPAKRKDAFCQTMATINARLQDDGLIFAPGDRELLESDHGKIYCTTLLLNKYLAYGTMLSLNKDDTFAPPPVAKAPRLPLRARRAAPVRMVMPTAPNSAPQVLPTETAANDTPDQPIAQDDQNEDDQNQLTVNETHKAHNSMQLEKLPPPSRDHAKSVPPQSESQAELESF